MCSTKNRRIHFPTGLTTMMAHKRGAASATELDAKLLIDIKEQVELLKKAKENQE